MLHKYVCMYMLKTVGKLLRCGTHLKTTALKHDGHVILCETPFLGTALSKTPPPLQGNPTKLVFQGFCSRVCFLVRRTMSSTSPKQILAENEAKKIELLSAVEDSYDGVKVELKDPMDSKDYVPALRASISKWRQQRKKGVWIKLPLGLANLVEPTVQEGFRYHHAEPDYLMLVYWIPDTPDTLPVNASHRVGIAAFVLNENKELLVVKEKHGKFRGTGVWKLPTGVVNEGEDICAAAVREVKEEAGIETEFVELLAFRECHRSFFGKSDIMFVCALRPQTLDIQRQASEVEDVQWMSVQKYVDQPYNKERQGFKYVAEICRTKAESDYVGFSAAHLDAGSSKKSCLYYNGREFSAL